MSDIDRKLVEIAAKQHSLVTLRDIAEAEGGSEWGNRRVAAGRWELVYDGVYRIAGVPWTYEAKVMALVLAAGEGAVASHRCAMRLLGLGHATAIPEITIPRGRQFRARRHFVDDDHPDGGRKRDFLVHTSTDLDRCETVLRNGIPLTDPARTLLDIARKLGGVGLKNVVEEARRDGLVTWHDLIKCASAHARRGRPGIRRLRTVVAAGAVTDEITDTDSELAAVGLLREYGFGEPRLQHRIYEEDGARLVAEMDTAYVDKKVNIEIDGPVHLLPAVRLKDEKRDQMLRREYGWTVRRVWYTIPVKEPDLFVAIVKEVFAEEAAKGQPKPSLYRISRETVEI